jgi:hypothetical protein
MTNPPKIVGTALVKENGLFRLLIFRERSVFHNVSLIVMRETDRAAASKLLRSAYRKLDDTMPKEAVYYIYPDRPCLVPVWCNEPGKGWLS